MNRTEWFLAILMWHVAVLTLSSGLGSETPGVVALVPLLVIYLLPVYVVGHEVYDRVLD